MGRIDAAAFLAPSPPVQPNISLSLINDLMGLQDTEGVMPHRPEADMIQAFIGKLMLGNYQHLGLIRQQFSMAWQFAPLESRSELMAAMAQFESWATLRQQLAGPSALFNTGSLGGGAGTDCMPAQHPSYRPLYSLLPVAQPQNSLLHPLLSQKQPTLRLAKGQFARTILDRLALHAVA